MYVCICRQVTDHQIRDVCSGGASNFSDVQAQTGVASECGKCGKLAQTIVKEFSKSTPYSNAA
ncbi:MAG: (2Fe-2S)-binding protein [Gammaproteobacteria bacterium]|nr:(2Fe-2S)-binding protein [Gammaproteobacteria bacterium]MDD9894184.1 (2Fe-2S)-binding protein [Gammaproteobacteria bacterium]